jgi:3-hydroxyacyl-CoA dehydrogenase
MEAADVHIGVVGSGSMGSGLTEVAARAGFGVVLRSRTRDAAEATLAQVTASFAKQVAKGRLEDADARAALDRISMTTHLEDLEGCDIVIESVVEDLDIKKSVFAGLDEAVKPGAILATNTSTLPVIELAAWTNGPTRSAVATASTRRRPWPSSKSGGPAPPATKPSRRRWPSPKRAARTRSRWPTGRVSS